MINDINWEVVLLIAATLVWLWLCIETVRNRHIHHDDDDK